MSVVSDLMAVVGLDTKGFKEGANQVKSKNKEMESSLGSLDKTVNKVEGSFKTLLTRVAGFALAYLSIRSVTSSISDVVHFNDALGELSETLGVSVEELSVWGNAVQKNGGTAEGFQNTIKGLTGSLTAFATKGKSLIQPFFAELGIRMTDAKGKAREVFDILPELANKFQGLSKSESFGIGQKLGLDEGTIRLLQKGGKELDQIIKRQKELGVVTKQDAEIAAKFNDQWDDTAHAFRTLYTQVASAILPGLTKVFNLIEKGVTFTKDNKDVIVGALVGIGAILTYTVLPALIRIGVASLVAFAPFYLIGGMILGVVAAMALLYDDLKQYFAGNKSVIGSLIERFPALEGGLQKTADVLRTIRDVVVSIGRFFLQAFTDPLAAWDTLKNSISAGISKITGLFPALKELGSSITDYFKKVASEVTFVKVVVAAVKTAITATIDAIAAAIGKLGDAFVKVKNFFTGGGNVNGSLSATQEILHTVNSSPLNTQSSGSILNQSKSSNRNTSFNINDINIQTQATSVEGIAGGIESALQSQITQALNNADDGVMA